MNVESVLCKEEGYVVGRAHELNALRVTGITLSMLRPMGKVEISGSPIRNVRMAILKKVPIRVNSINGTTLIVAKQQMHNSAVFVLIPSRYHASRLPGKALLRIEMRPLFRKPYQPAF